MTAPLQRKAVEEIEARERRAAIVTILSIKNELHNSEWNRALDAAVDAIRRSAP